MKRRSAIIIGAAVTLPLLAGAVVAGAHTGALGFASSPPPSVAPPLVAGDAPKAVADISNGTTASNDLTSGIGQERSGAGEHEHEHDHEHEHEAER